MSEVITVLSQRIGKKKAKDAVELLYGNRVDMLDVTRKTEADAFDAFLK